MTPKNRRVAPKELGPDVMDVAATPAIAPADAPPAAAASSCRAAVRAVLGAALVLGLSTTVAWAARRHVLSSPRFAVDEIVVRGDAPGTARAGEARPGSRKG